VVKELSLILLNFTLDFWLYTEDGADIKIEYHSGNSESSSLSKEYSHLQFSQVKGEMY